MFCGDGRNLATFSGNFILCHHLSTDNHKLDMCSKTSLSVLFFLTDYTYIYLYIYTLSNHMLILCLTTWRHSLSATYEYYLITKRYYLWHMLSFDTWSSTFRVIDNMSVTFAVTGHLYVTSGICRWHTYHTWCL